MNKTKKVKSLSQAKAPQLKTLEFLPNGWLYNAGVIGFLKVVEKAGDKVICTSDGKAIATITKTIDEIYQAWEELSREKSERYYVPDKGNKYKYYANQNQNTIKDKISQLIYPINKTSKSIHKISCSICGEMTTVRSSSKFLTQAFSSQFFASEKTFPNMYWSFRSKDLVCPKCEFVLLCHHLAFIMLSDKTEVFINGDSFEVMKRAYNNLLKNSSNVNIMDNADSFVSIYEVLANKVLESYQKISTWQSSGLEIITKYYDKSINETKINFSFIDYKAQEILKHPEVKRILKNIKEFEIYKILIDGNFGDLLNLVENLIRYKILRNHAKKKVSNAVKSYLKRLETFKNKKSFKQTVKELLNLYLLIQKITKNEEENMNQENQISDDTIKDLMDLGTAIRMNDHFESLKKSLLDQIFIILEKTRQGAKDEVHYSLLRVFAANKKVFPKSLKQVFLPSIPEDLFKTCIYAFLSSLIEEKSNEENNNN
mgnify:CR=1 FL=1